MNSVRKYTDLELIQRVESLSTFQGWKVGMYDFWVRSKEDTFNQFDDKVYTFEVLKEGKRPVFRMVCTGTTNAGKNGLKHFDNYNKDGCAILKSDVIIYDSHLYGRHKNYMAYRQHKGYPYYRDNDKDDFSEELGEVHNDIIYANCHAAGDLSRYIDGWSLACLVRNVKKQFQLWMKLMNKRPLSVAIIKEF